MNTNLKTFFILALTILAFDSVASEVSGIVRLCRADGKTTGPRLLELIPNGTELKSTDGSASIIITPANNLQRGICVERRVGLVGDGSVPVKGAKWSIDVPYKNQGVAMIDGKMTTTENVVNYTVTAEAIGGFAPLPAGKIKICRHLGLTEMMDKQNIPIPSGASFTNSGPTSEFVVTTTENVRLGPKPGCAIARAAITENLDNRRVTKKSGRLEAQFVIAGADLEAVVIEDFK